MSVTKGDLIKKMYLNLNSSLNMMKVMILMVLNMMSLNKMKMMSLNKMKMMMSLNIIFYFHKIGCCF